MTRPEPAVALVLAAVALPGCGGSDDAGSKTQPASPPAVQSDQRAILATIEALQTASRSGDARRICNVVFTPQLARSIKRSAKRSCAREVRERLFTPDASISVQRGIQVKGVAATAVIREQNGNVSTLHLVKQADRWRIDRVTPKKAGTTS